MPSHEVREADGSIRRLLLDLYVAATAAAEPGAALTRALADTPLAPGRRPWVLALGKAAVPMARAAVAHLTATGAEPAGGLVVAPAAAVAPHPAIGVVVGDHPAPGAGSLAAATRLGEVAAQVRPDDEVWVLLSGGTTSLVGAPVDGIPPADLASLYSLLLASGLDITAMNRIRKRFSRWGGGRLAAALAPARVRVFVVSDVIGDDLASIGSGPCVPDPTTAEEIRADLERAGLWTRLPRSLRERLDGSPGQKMETPKPGDPAFERVTVQLIASNSLALEAAARRAAELGLVPEVERTPIAGEASAAGTSVAATLLTYEDVGISQHPRRCRIWGGETTVTLGHDPGLGGRSQELALAAARRLAGRGPLPAVLAAGTDGRDGPTDAAGAVVDGTTWEAIRAAGRDPERDLARHDAYHALDAVGALIRPGLTGTNVMDVVIGVW